MINIGKIILALLVFYVTTFSSLPVQAAGEVDYEVYFEVRPGVPAWAFIQETVVLLQVGESQPVVLESIYPMLYAGWRNQYLKVNDYDHDGLNDLAILQSVGHGGNDRCYAVYRYNPRSKAFNGNKSFDRCNI